jgi:hypothetical protein
MSEIMGAAKMEYKGNTSHSAWLYPLQFMWIKTPESYIGKIKIWKVSMMIKFYK